MQITLKLSKVVHSWITSECVSTFSCCRLTQNRGIYMFRINNEQVIDATLTGGPAR